MQHIGDVGNTRIDVWRGDISTLRADALVNAANNHLWMGAGVAGALKRAGGEEIEREAVSRGPIEIGSAVATTAGKLPAKCVIHAAVMGQDLRTSADVIRRATRASLTVASSQGLASVGLPVFGTGVGGFPKQDAAREMIDAVISFLGSTETTLKRAVFVVYDEETERIFVAELRQRLRVS